MGSDIIGNYRLLRHMGTGQYSQVGLEHGEKPVQDWVG